MFHLEENFSLAAKIIAAVAQWRLDQGFPPGDTWRLEDVTEAGLQKLHDLSQTKFYVFYQDKTPIGAFTLSTQDDYELWTDLPEKKSFYLHRFSILPTFMKQGFAEQILNLIKAKTKADKLESLRLDTGSHQPKLVKLYEQNGFVRRGTWGPDAETGLTWFLYEWNYQPFETTNSEIKYENPWIRVREDKIIRPNGQTGIYGVMESRDSVTVMAKNENDEIFLVHSYSYPAGKWHWELPAGGTDGENVIVASRRELEEETGIRAENWEILGKTRPMDGLATEQMTTLLATRLTIGARPPEDDDPIDEARFFSLEQIHQLIKSGEIDEGQTISSLYLYEVLFLKKI